MDNEDIFEQPPVEETPIDETMDSNDNELDNADNMGDEPVVVEEKPVEKVDRRKGKSKRVLTDEQKQKLRENLAKGRAKSIATRKRKMELRKIEKEEKISEDEKRVLAALEQKRNKSRESKDLLGQIEELKYKLAQKDKEIEQKSKEPKEQKSKEPLREKVQAEQTKAQAKPKAQPKAKPKAEPKESADVREKKLLMNMLRSLR